MQYFNMENAEYLMGRIVSKMEARPWAQHVAEHNGVKCAMDGYRAAVILPEGAAEWDFTDANFETGDADNPRFEIGSYFNGNMHGDNNGFSDRNESKKIDLTKEQAALLLISFDGAKTDAKRRFGLAAIEAENRIMVCVDMDSMGMLTEQARSALSDTAAESVMGFNVMYIEEAFKFLMCSDDGNIEIYFNGINTSLIMKSGRLYAIVMPVRWRKDTE